MDYIILIMAKEVFMDKDFIFNSNFISGVHMEEVLGKYTLSFKCGNLCTFDLNQLSNQPHFHNCYELCLVTSGEGTLIYKDSLYKLATGDIFITDSNVIHEVHVNKYQNLQVLFLFLEILDKEDTTPKSSDDTMIVSFLHSHKTIAYGQKHMLAYLLFIENYYNVKKTFGYGINKAFKSFILESLETLSDHLQPNAYSSNHVLHSSLELALDFIDRHLCEKMMIGDIAKHCHSSVRNLQHLFRKHFDQTIVDYINERKITLASHYLMRQYSVYDTSIQIGINDTSQFTRLFKKYRSITPKRYQQLNCSKNKDFGRRQQIE